MSIPLLDLELRIESGTAVDDRYTSLRRLPMRRSVEFSEAMLQSMDVVVAITDPSAVNCQRLVDSARLVDLSKPFRGKCAAAEISSALV